MSLIMPNSDIRIKPPLGARLNTSLGVRVARAWLMNEGLGARVADAMGGPVGAFDGTWSANRWGRGPEFVAASGHRLIVPGYVDEIGLTSAFTVLAVLRVTSKRRQFICSQLRSPSDRFGIWISDSAFQIRAQYYNGSAYVSAVTGVLTYGQWYVLAVTHATDGTWTMYVDGKINSTGTTVGYSATSDGTNQFVIGAWAAASGLNYFDGSLSCLMISPGVWTTQQIRDMAVDPFLLFRRPTIEWWGAGLGVPSGADYSFTINDGMGVSDDRSNLASLIRSVAEGLGLSDNASPISALLRTLSDAMGIEDAESASAAIVRGLNEAVGLTDAESKLSVAVRQVADSLGLVDSVGCLSVLLRTISDAEGVTDGQILSRMLVVADEIGAADEIGRVVAYLRTKSESVGLSDEVIEGATAAIAKTISDAMGLSDEAVRLSVVVRGVLDGIGIADAAQRLSVCLRVVTDSLGITDGTAMARSMAVAETMGLSSSWSKAVGYLRAQSDSMSLADDYASAWAVLRTIDETLGVTDQMIQEGVAVLVRIISDVVGATDSRSQVHEALRVLTESVATSDSVARLFAVSRVIAEVEGLTDVASRGRFYMIADTLGISDEVARLVGFLRSCDEGVGVIEAILRVSGVVRRLDDSMGVTDSEQHFLSGLVQAAVAFLILRKSR